MLDWQNAITLTLVVAAAVYVGRVAWRAVRAKRAGGCGSGCHACPAGEPPEQDVLSIEPLGQPRRD